MKRILLSAFCLALFQGANAQAPVAAFTQNSTSICEDGTVQFTDLSTNSPTTWEWIIPGAVPSTSPVQSPVFQFNNPGVYNVTLIVTNLSGSDTLVENSLIEVKPKPFAQITPGVSNPIGICPGDSIQLFANQGAGLTYEWFYYSNFLGTSQSIWANRAGTYRVRVTDNATGCAKRSGLRDVESYPRPFVFVFPPASNTICQGDSMLLETINNAGYQYQWYRGDHAINNATGIQFYAKKNGYYRVELTNTFGCKKKSDKYGLPITITCRLAAEQPVSEQQIQLYPNPASGAVTVDVASLTDDQVHMELYDITGKLVHMWPSVQVSEGLQSMSLDVSSFENGIYLLRVKGDTWNRTTRLVVEH